MKINSVDVYDPRDFGEFDRPIIRIELEDEPYSNSEPKLYQFGDSVWHTEKFGPFVRYHCDDSNKNFAGHYNVAFRGIFPAIVDVEVLVAPVDSTMIDNLKGNFGLPLKRARQYLRQFDAPWRLLMNDHDGQSGLVDWTPVEKPPRCKWYDPYKAPGNGCSLIAVQSVFTQGIEMPYCTDHLFQHNKNQKNARQSSR